MIPRVAAIQMCSSADWQTNCRVAEQALAQAAEQGASIAVLPENFAAYGVDYRAFAQHSEEAVLDWLGAQATKTGLYLIGGSVPSITRPNGEPVPAPRVRTRTHVVSPLGETVAMYDKLHLFDAEIDDKQGRYCESAVFEPGDESVVVACGELNVGLAICYDLRFPLLARRLADAGAQLLVYPSAFTALTGKAHWELLLRATAVQTGCYILGANQCGQHSERRESYGHSMLINPWGEIVSTLDDKPGVLLAEVDASQQQRIRQRIPVHEHQRFQLEGPYER